MKSVDSTMLPPSTDEAIRESEKMRVAKPCAEDSDSWQAIVETSIETIRPGKPE